ncbi:aldo/keto reductase family protein [Arthrobacter sp. AZCC_0090]|uniref:aldo/keto reductase family protein n=1 Tax=Arthrobacter sp. AZCC_0090 TaxID=2735881 RepID=UPI00161EB4C1|nr:aldo/keto reductase family protein [Arthrobacter sp. AZCC_0090]MBB6402837.1 aryl-alcohol dehydrogenase-like predicted oxidoreductase [Arthrobacter sp. AZCC_0090]
MEYRKLGSSGMYISELAYGNWVTHGEQIDQDTANACVRQALDLGITTFDTADAYAGTRAETALGEALKGVRREGLEIFTKVYFPTGEGKNDRGLSRKHVMESVNGSLRRLGTDYVDLYQAHRFDYETPLEETMQAFADIVRAGKALYVGVSEWTVDEIRAGAALAKELGIQLISNQPQYSMLWRVIEEEVVPASQELGLGQICWSPLAQGVLTGKYIPGQNAPSAYRFATEEGELKAEHKFMRPEVLERVQALKPIAEEAGLSMAALALAWVLQNSNVSAAIVGASGPEQLVDNATAVGITLDPELLARIDTVLDPVIERDPSKVESFTTRP